MAYELVRLKADGNERARPGDILAQLLEHSRARGVPGGEIVVYIADEAAVLPARIVEVAVGVEELCDVKVIAQLHLTVVHVEVPVFKRLKIVLPCQLLNVHGQSERFHIACELAHNAGLRAAVGADDELELYLLRGAGHVFKLAVVIVILYAGVLEDKTAGLEVIRETVGILLRIVRAGGVHRHGRGGRVSVHQLLGKIRTVKGVVHRLTEAVEAADIGFLVEHHIVIVRGGIVVDLAGAGIAEVRVARWVVRDDIDDAVVKGGDAAGRVRVLHEKHRVYREVLIIRVIWRCDKIGLVLAVHIGPTADGLGVAVGAVFDDGDIQQLYKLRVANAERDIEAGIVIAGALIAREAAAETVGVYRGVERIAQVAPGDGRTVAEIVPLGDLEGPVGGLLVADPARQQVRDDLKAVVELDHVLIHKAAHELV